MNLLRPGSEAPPAPRRVGEYRLLARIGEGGMGVVHLAQGPDGRRVALKVLRPHVVGDDEARERLSREVASLHRVSSPRIAEVVYADPWAETPYVATRYVPGLSLHQHVEREGPLAGEDLRHVAAGLAEAVLAVHAVGVLHRDIKPSNVLVEGRSPVLIDFGLARLAEDSRLTMTGWLLGTPGYLAPEILYGDDATVASDVHAWAATVVFACTGRPPFGRGPAVAIMDRVRRGEHDLSGVPDDWLPLLRTCLAPDPRDRPGLTTVLSDLGPAGTPPVAAVDGAAAPDELTLPLALADGRLDHPGDPDDPDAPTDLLDAPTTTPIHEPDDRWTDRWGDWREDDWRDEDWRDEDWRDDEPAGYAPAPWVPPPGGSAWVRRVLLHLGLLGLVTVGLAAAPYLAVGVFAIGVLGARTVSRASDSRRDRVLLRGRPRWYDAPAMVIASPWHLLMATGATVVLLLWSVLLTSAVVVGCVLAGVADLRSLLAGGATLALVTWWGPWARRLRVPVRRGIVRSTRSAGAGWFTVAVVAVAVLVPLVSLLGQGTLWLPEPGPPWRAGTPLDTLRGLF